MCSNYRPTTGRDLIRFGVEPPDELIVGRDVYPGDVGPMLLRADDAPVLSCVAGTFGLLPVWAKERSFARRTYNARSETVAEKPSFRNAWRQQQRCIVPARAIYEPSYESGKAEWWRIEDAEGLPLALAGLWERKQWEEGGPSWSFTLLTVNAAGHPVMSRFHKPKAEKRSVVFLDDDAQSAWLEAGSADEASDVFHSSSVDLIAHAGRLPTG